MSPAAEIDLAFDARPSALRYMLGAFRPSPGLPASGPLPSLRARWNGVRVPPRHLADACALAELTHDATLPLLLPQVIGFRLVMALLTHPGFPIPIWRMLQVRNRIRQHRPVPADACFDLETAVATHRVLDRGVEFDLRLALSLDGGTAWESVVTFYARGRFGEAADTPVPPPASAPLAAAHRWTAQRAGRLRFGFLTGDYNGIHLSGTYARRFGFARAFMHPQRALGAILARSPGGAAAAQLDVLLKGPVPYGAPLALHAGRIDGGTAFALHVGDDPRPALLGTHNAPSG